MASPTPDFPRYEVLTPLGEGAVATVFKVRSSKDGSIRALKALKPEQAETERAIARFEDEYRILSNLHHPSLPDVNDYGVAPDGTRFIVMEYLEGEPLDEYLAAHPEDFWTLLFQMNEALAFIHEHDLLHLDLKPGNILVRRSRAFGEREMPLVMLIDFGLSYRRESGGKVKLVGTPGYMSPEVIRGEENITRAADYYSLGVILYELTEGRLPFAGSMHDILRAHLTRKVTFEARKVEFAELVPWIENLMAKEPQARLAAFQDYQRTMAARMGDDAAEMERVFALGYIDSLGLVGKEEAWDELRTWAEKLAAAVESRSTGVPAGSGEAAVAVPDLDVPDPDSVLKGSVTDLEKRIQEDLLASAAVREKTEGPIAEIPRVLAVSGPPESGKTHVLDTLATEIRVRGMQVLRLGEDSDYPTIVGDAGKKSQKPSSAVDPAALTTDRFVAGWEKLVSLAEGAGAVLVADDLTRLSGEERDFLEYVGKRLGHVVSEGTEPNLFIICVGKSKPVREVLRPALIGDGAFASIEVPPPGTDDVEAISERFRGHLSGRAEQQSLEVFLRKHLQSSTALYASLKQGISEDALVHRIGKWAFHESRASAIELTKSSVEYYESLFEELADNAKDLVGWLACHPQALTVDELAQVSDLSVSQIVVASEALLPYRIIDVADTDKGRRIEMISDHVRGGMYKALRKKDRNRIHNRYISYFGDHGDDSIAYFEMMAHHFAKVRRVRESLIMQVRAVTRARRDRDVFALRRLCKAGIEYVRRLRSAEWKDHKESIERYFIKQWINAEWMVSNYKNLIEIIQRNRETTGGNIPIGHRYRYAVALERTNKPQLSVEIVEEGLKELRDWPCETYHRLLIQRANILTTFEQTDDSLGILEKVDLTCISTEDLARYYIIKMINYDRSGEQESYAKYLEKARVTSDQHGHIEHLVRAHYSEGQSLLNQSRFQEAKSIIASSVRLAHKTRYYRGLCIMYFLGSAVFFEEGKFQRALYYLDKSMKIAVDNGLLTDADEFGIRYAMIYQNVGLWGDAVSSLESIRKRTDTRDALEHHFYATVLLFNILSSLNSRLISSVADRLETMIERIKARYRAAVYYQVLGEFLKTKDRLDEAIGALEKAKELYAAIGYSDDLARTDIVVAMIRIEQREFDEARNIIDHVGSQIGDMESNNVRGQYLLVELLYHQAANTSKTDLFRWIGRCEDIMNQVTEMDLLMKLNASLFRVLVKVGEVGRGLEYFHRYYSQMRKIVSGLQRSELVDDFSNSPEFLGLVEEYRGVTKNGPGHSSGD